MKGEATKSEKEVTPMKLEEKKKNHWSLNSSLVGCISVWKRKGEE
jgi:hypothetical protein